VQKNLLKTLTSKETIYKFQWELLFLGLTTLIHILILALPTQLAFGDLAPFPENFGQGATDFFYAWRDVAFGFYRHPGNITNLLQSVLVLVFGSAFLAQKIYVVFLLPFLAFTALRHLLTKHFGAKNDPLLFITAFFYTYSPIMLTEFVGGTQYSTMLFFAILPFVASLSLDILVPEFKTDLYKSSLKLLLSLILLFSVNIQSVPIYGIFIAVTLLGKLFFTPKESFAKRFVGTLRTGLVILTICALALVANPIYAVSNFKIINPTPQFDSEAGFINSYSTFLNDVKYTYSRSTLLNTIRLGGNLSDFKYTRFTFWTIPFLMLSLITLGYALYEFKRSSAKRKIFVIGYILTSLFLYLTYLELTHPIFLKFPVLFMFRNPAKPTLLNTLFFCVCFFEVFKNLSLRYTKLFYLSIYFAVIIYIWPIFLGDRGLAYTRNDFTIPQEYYTIINTIKQDAKSDDYRTIWLPSTYESQSIKLTWIDRGRIEDQLGLSEFSTDNFGSYSVKAINNSVIDNDKVLFKNLLQSSNIRYVILAKDKEDEISSNDFYSSTTLGSGYKTLNAFLADETGIFENRDYKVYRLNTLPIIFSLSKVNELNFMVGSSASILKDYYKNYTLPLVKKNSQTSDLITAKTDNNDLSNHILEWDEFWTWPDPQINPQNPIFSVMLYKEKLGFNWRNDAITKVNFATWIIANRAVEINKFRLRGTALDRAISNIEFYEKYIKNHYQQNGVVNDLDRDTAVKTIVFLTRAQKSMDISSTVLDEVIALINAKIDEGYKDLCITNCVKVLAKNAGTYHQLAANSKPVQINNGINKIEITPEQKIFSSGTEPSTTSPLVYELKNLISGNKYVLEFDYQTNGNIYELSLFNQFRNLVNYRYDYDVYLEQTLTSEVRAAKHFRAFFIPKNHSQSLTILKIEMAGKSPNRDVNVTNVSVTPLPSRSITLISSGVQLDKSTESPKQVQFTKLSPVLYKIKAREVTDYLVFAGNYNTGWKLYADNGAEIAKNNHQLINTYGNVWKIDSADLNSTENITLKFDPQNDLNWSLIFSGLFVTIVTLLIIRRQKTIIK
jgi:hypothetical protein